MELKISFNMDNAAFEETNGYEVARILRKLASKIDGTNLEDDDSFTISDANGNKIGQLRVTGD